MKKNYENMTRKELYEEVKTKGFKGTSRYKKSQLLELLVGKKPPVNMKKKDKLALTPDNTGASDMSHSRTGAEIEDIKTTYEPVEPEGVYVDWGEPLPDNYNIDRISAAAKDPTWLFVNWDLTGPKHAEVAQAYGKEVFDKGLWHLRLLDIRSGSKVDFSINVESRNWYVPVSPDGLYKVMIGLLTGEGNFIEFAVTREVRMPRSGPSDKVSEEWAVADEQFQKFLKQVEQAGAEGLSSSGMVK